MNSYTSQTQTNTKVEEMSCTAIMTERYGWMKFKQILWTEIFKMAKDKIKKQQRKWKRGSMDFTSCPRPTLREPVWALP